MNQYRKLLGNTLAITIGNFASKILVFLMLPIYTSCLSTEEYGIVDLVYTSTNLLYPILTLLASEIALRFALDKNIEKEKVFSIVLKLHTVGFLIMLLLSPLLKLVPQLYEHMGVFFLYYFCITLSNIVSQFAKGCNSVKAYAFSGFLNTSITIALNILFLICFDWGINGYLFAYIVGSVVTIIYLIIYLKLYRYIKLFDKTDYGLLKKMLSYSVPMIPNSMCWWVNNSLDRYVLLTFFNASVLGIYAASNKIPSLLTVFTSIFINAWQISSVDDFGSEKNRSFFSEIYKKYSTVVIGMTFVIIALSRIITKILLSDDFAVAGNFVQILVFAFMFQAMSGFLGTVYTASKKTSTLFISTLFGAVINLGLNFIFVPKYECMGAAVATAISYVIVWAIRLYKSRSIIKLSIRLKKDILCYLLIIAESLLVIFKIKYYPLYVVLLLIFVVILNYKEIKDILNIHKIKNMILKKR